MMSEPTPEPGGSRPPRPPAHAGRSPRDRDAPEDHEWPIRPSTLVAASVCLAGVLAIGVTGGFPVPAVLAAVSGPWFAVAVAYLDSPDPLATAGGTAVGIASAGGLFAAIAMGPVLPMAALSLAAFGAGAVPTGAIGRNRLTEAMGILVYSLVPVGVTAVAAIFFGAITALIGASLGLLQAGSAGASLTGFAVLAVAAIAAVRGALRVLPIAELAAKDDRERIRDRIDGADRRLSQWLWVALAVLVASVLIWAFLGTGVAWLSDVLAPVAALAGSPLARIPLFVAAVIAGVLAVTGHAVRWAGGTVIERTRRGIAAAVGVGVTILLVALHRTILVTAVDVLDPDIAVVIQEFVGAVGPVSTVLMATTFVVIGFVMALLAIPGAVGVGLASDRAAGPAFAAAGLLGGAGLAVKYAPAVAVLAGVVAAMVVWDLGEFGVGMAEEVEGASADRAELVHAAGTIGIGVIVFGGAVGAHALVTRFGQKGSSALAALAVIFVGIVLLAAALRG